jgi:hypothetical protein
MPLRDADLLAHRLRNQKLVGSNLRRAEDVVSWLGAVQSQDYPGARWALGLRAPGIADADVERAFNAGRILRTHVLRPTWHFVAPADLRWLLTLSAPRVHQVSGSVYRYYELDRPTLARSRRVLERALRDGAFLTRSEIAAELARAKVVAAGTRLAYIVIHAELERVVTSGPVRGKQFTYGLFDERVTKSTVLEGDAALAELVRRYFTSHGPATVRDFVWWSGLTTRQAMHGLAIVKPALVKQVIGERTYWSATETPRASRAPSGAYLLPNYDEYLIAYKDRGPVVDVPKTATAIVEGRDAYGHVLVVNGRFAGIWRRRVAGGKLDLEAVPYRPLARDDVRALKAATQQLGAFLNVPATLGPFGKRTRGSLV